MALFVVSYLAGVLTIVSPCILPVLPFVLARAGQPFARGVLPMLVGMASTFAIVASLAVAGGGWAIQAGEFGRVLALALLTLFGLTLAVPRAASILSRPAVELGRTLASGRDGKQPSLAGALLLGVATGLLWTPCAGPILGLVLTGAALRGANPETTLLLLAYAGGAATSMALAVLAGGRLRAVLRRALGPGQHLRQLVGVAVLVGVAAIALRLDTGQLARLPLIATAKIEQSLLDRLAGSAMTARAAAMGLPEDAAPASATAGRYRSDLPVEGWLPRLEGAVTWLNGPPLTTAQLRGKVVLVDFWTYSCINCIRTLPYVRAWAEKYRARGLVVIGVHTPEFAFEKKVDNVKEAIRDFEIEFPVAVDNDYRLWRAFDNNYWPALYFADAQGRIRHHQFGEGGYGEAERAIQDLLKEAGGRAASDAGFVRPNAPGAQAAADLADLRSSESYLGFEKASGFVATQRVETDVPEEFTGAPLQLDQWSLTGTWTVGADHIALDHAGGTIRYRFRARDLHLVLGAAADGKPVRFEVSVDGRPPGADHGADIDAEGNGTIGATRLYQLVRQSGGVNERTFEVRFLDPGAQAYVFTFG